MRPVLLPFFFLEEDALDPALGWGSLRRRPIRRSYD